MQDFGTFLACNSIAIIVVITSIAIPFHQSKITFSNRPANPIEIAAINHSFVAQVCCLGTLRLLAQTIALPQ
ncbi:hypothetical protein [Phormidesmis sp. 146-33]